MRFFDEVAPAAIWAESLARSCGGPSASELAQAVDTLRPRFRGRAALTLSASAQRRAASEVA